MAEREVAKPGTGVGYEDAELVEVVFRKTVALRHGPSQPLDAATCRIATGLVHRPKVVFDIGGACGATFFRLRPLIDWKLTWNVVETPAMAARAGALADAQLRFYDSMPSDPPDLVVASGVLQYLPDPLAGLTGILARRPDTIVLTRTALADRAPSFVQQTRLGDNGPGPMPPGFRDREVAYKLRAAPRASVVSLLSADYVLHAFDELETVRAPRFGPRVETVGWLARRRDARP